MPNAHGHSGSIHPMDLHGSRIPGNFKSPNGTGTRTLALQIYSGGTTPHAFNRQFLEGDTVTLANKQYIERICT